ncbi:TPA: DUF4822 domain-containing protein [Stenotrophomonas maltophilia]|uniref:DUF4822 domain-containing protein n=1 Tax=Stenotrophomonas maltophilia TaxID=40324 RepID=UPI0015DE3772|nr:DUF4822 domain-containing protein [Stenotrophomonas maltophilia]MBA0448647.1 DUF4822 domain-containing protein [Stenotrophomonas maltophilia]HEL2981154.1 DUF4822 domain-containing protein [Stenotrophomonas maltophilia]
MRLPVIMALACLLPVFSVSASPTDCALTDPRYAALAGTLWLTTAVHENGDTQVDHSGKYPAVVGISRWDACRNRFEYFDPETAQSRAASGGSGYFLFTGDGRYQITLPDHASPIRRRMDVMTPQEFTYSRRVPEGMKPGMPDVTIQVVHTPYKGSLQISPSVSPTAD